MYPPNNYGNPSFTSTTIKPKALSSFYNYNNDVNLSKTPPSSSSFQLLSPHCITLEDEMILSDLLQQENLLSDDTNMLLHQPYSTHDIRACLQSAMEKCNNNGNFVRKDGDGGNDGFKAKKSGTRRRSSKKDRHSKINTAQGPRERRMRLSIDVAKKFFKLQDMLGFDKASKTVEWLLMKSKSGIQELIPDQQLNRRSSCFMAVSNTASSTSKCEVLSGNIDNGRCIMKTTGGDQATPKFQAKPSSSRNCKEKKIRMTSRGVRKNAHLHSPLAKETRERARARARERTVEKSSKLRCNGDDQYSKSRPCLYQTMDDQDINLLGSSTIDQPEQQSSHFQFKQGIISDNSLLTTANWSPSSLFSYQHAGVLPHEHQFNDFQILGNLWEGNN